MVGAMNKDIKETLWLVGFSVFCGLAIWLIVWVMSGGAL